MSDKKRQKSYHYVYHYVIRKKSTCLVLKEHKRKDKIKGEGPIDKSIENLQDMIYLYLTYQLQILKIKSESLYFEIL
jgi:hypothetical protein